MESETQDVVTLIKALRPNIQRICEISGVPGASIGVGYFGSVLYRAVYGCRDVESRMTPDRDTIYALGGLAKPIIASAIGILVHEEKLSYNTRVAEIIPELRRTCPLGPTGKIMHQITVSDLLCHRAGLAKSNYWWQGAEGKLLLEKKDAVSFYSKLDVSGLFRADWSYSDWGYALLGEIIEKVTGQSCGAYVEGNIFKPLGMDDSSTQQRPLATFENIAKPYATLDDGTPFPLPQPPVSDRSIMFAAQGMWSTVDDLLKFSLALLAAYQWEMEVIKTSPTPVLKNVRAQLAGHVFTTTSTMDKSYGYGLFRSQLPSVVAGLGCNASLNIDMPVIVPRTHSSLVAAHGGRLPGYTNSLALLPLQGSCVVVLTNAMGLGDASEWITLALIEAVLRSPKCTDFVAHAKNAAVSHTQLVHRMAEFFEAEVNERVPLPGFPAQYAGIYARNQSWEIEIRLTTTHSLEVAFQKLPSQAWPMFHVKGTIFTWLATRDDQAKRGRLTTNITLDEFTLIFSHDEHGLVNRLYWPHEPGVPLEMQCFHKRV